MKHEKCFVEVDKILNHLKEEDYNKIPKHVIKAIKDNRDLKYIWEYDETKELKEQNISRDTIAMLSYLNMEYLLDAEQKELMERIHELNEQKVNKVNEESSYGSDIFPKKTDNIKKENVIENENKELTLDNVSIFKKFLNFIKGILKNNKKLKNY